MSELSKITASHRSRVAAIYVRQSTLAQLERNTESTARQYDLVERALALGWPRGQIRVIDAGQGLSLKLQIRKSQNSLRSGLVRGCASFSPCWNECIRLIAVKLVRGY